MSGLSNGWRSTVLSEIADIKGGLAKGKCREKEAVTRSVPFLRVANVQRGYLDLSEMHEIDASEGEIQDLALQAGDVLLNEGGDRDKLGRGWVWENQLSLCIHQNHVFRARPIPGVVDPYYLSHWANSPDAVAYFLRSGTQTTNLASINKSNLSSLPVPLPSFSEQRRIATILDNAWILRRKRRAALAKLDTLAQSIFVEMFDDPVKNAMGWPERTLSSFIDGFESGKNLVADDQENSDSVFRVLKISAVTSLEYLPGEAKALPPSYVPPESHIVKPGDLLFSRANTTDLIGATVLVRTTPPNLVLPDKLWRVIHGTSSPTDSYWLLALFRTQAFRQEIGKRATGTSGSMKNISQEKVLSIKVGFPPLKLQQSFGLKFNDIERLIANQRVHLEKLDGFFDALQHRAFRGEL
jgi:type I restriction enzyme S subunit